MFLNIEQNVRYKIGNLVHFLAGYDAHDIFKLITGYNSVICVSVVRMSTTCLLYYLRLTHYSKWKFSKFPFLNCYGRFSFRGKTLLRYYFKGKNTISTWDREIKLIQRKRSLNCRMQGMGGSNCSWSCKSICQLYCTISSEEVCWADRYGYLIINVVNIVTAKFYHTQPLFSIYIF